VAQELAALPAPAFAVTKAQIRGPIAERLAARGAEIDREVTALWCADDTLARVRDYVARTLTK
jgi:enoyl-CoA hydratase